MLPSTGMLTGTYRVFRVIMLSLLRFLLVLNATSKSIVYVTADAVWFGWRS